MHENAIFSQIRGGGVRRVRPMLDPPLSDVCRRQILTTKIDPRTVRVKLFVMAVDPYHRYSNESERVD